MSAAEERREIARKLREDAANDKLREQVFVEEIIAGCIGETMHDEWGNVREVEILTRLAGLIDRPTCQMVECTIDHGFRSWGMRCTACGKEFEHMKPGFGWRFCPSCGAEVVDE